MPTTLTIDRPVREGRRTPLRPRFKVLAVAASCHPDHGSEPGLGWNWVRHLSAHHDLTVIAGELAGNREAIERELTVDPDLEGHLRFFFIPREVSGSTRVGQKTFHCGSRGRWGFTRRCTTCCVARSTTTSSITTDGSNGPCNAPTDS